MKIKRTVNVYSIKVPGTNHPTSFFDATSYSKLYFKSREEAQLFQQLRYPNLSVTKEEKIAILDQDKKGNDRWVILNLVEDMRNSNNNKGNTCSGYYTTNVDYIAAPNLEEIIKENKNSVIVVKEVDKHSWETDSGAGYGGPSGEKITYDCADTVDAATRFLYVDEHDNRWFVERGPEVVMTSADDLVLQYKLQENQRAIKRLQAEQEAMERELRQFQRVG